MRLIPANLKREIESRPEMHGCVGEPIVGCRAYCSNYYPERRPIRPEWEHCFIYAGKQVNEWWAIIGVCWFHHRGPGLNKNWNRYRAMIRMTKEDLAEAQKKYPNFNWSAELDRLKRKFEK